jgi:hypothetical protein
MRKPQLSGKHGAAHSGTNGVLSTSSRRICTASSMAVSASSHRPRAASEPDWWRSDPADGLGQALVQDLAPSGAHARVS